MSAIHGTKRDARAKLVSTAAAWGMCLPFALLVAEPVKAAEITHMRLASGMELIGIEGPIESGDLEKFREISIRHPKALVALNSQGGALLPAIEIGKIIKIADYATVVPDDAVCASSCALIWVAGSTRWLSPKGRVGFHASYRNNNGRPEESGLANALVGNYLTLLNLSQRAIVFATMASPNQITWLTRGNSASAGIDFQDFLPEGGQSQARTSSPAPTASPPITFAPKPLPSRPQKTGPNWIKYAENTSGTVLYYDKNSLNRSGNFIKSWILADHIKDKSIYHRESKANYELDCRNKSSAILAYYRYDRHGNVIQGDSFTGYEKKYADQIPGTTGMALWETLCLYESGDADWVFDEEWIEYDE